MTRLFNWIFKKLTDEKSSALLSFILALTLIFLLRSQRMPKEYIYFIYIPCLLIWLVSDFRKASKTVNEDSEK